MYPLENLVTWFPIVFQYGSLRSRCCYCSPKVLYTRSFGGTNCIYTTPLNPSTTSLNLDGNGYFQPFPAVNMFVHRPIETNPLDIQSYLLR